MNASAPLVCWQCYRTDAHRIVPCGHALAVFERGLTQGRRDSNTALVKALHDLLDDLSKHAHGLGALGHADHIRAAYEALAQAEGQTP